MKQKQGKQMTNGKLKVLSAAALIAVSGAVQASVSQSRHVTIEYEYARDGEIVSRKINGEVQRYEYDLRGQLTGVYDGSGSAVEAYQYDAAGNILKKTVDGRTTTFKYDAANQLVSKRDESGTTTYAYDAAGRMVREGDKEYRYSYLDKITSVLESGETTATMDYFVGGQIASVTRGNEAEQFIWDGLALVHRDGSDYLNEPAIGGGNPVASDGKVMLNDMLGSTVAVKGDESYSMTSMTAFGESSDSNAFFTGKPFVGEIGYAFLMRSYRPENGKWQTADPMGYPDGWNQLAYCNNGVTCSVDLWGCSAGYYYLVAGLYYYAANDIFAPGEACTTINSFQDALNHYRSGEGEIVPAGPGLISEMQANASYSDMISSLENIISAKLLRVPYSQTSGIISNAEGSSRGLSCLTLGSYSVGVEYQANWFASPWMQDLTGGYYRSVWSDFEITFSGYNDWDFIWNSEYSIWENVTTELVPGWIAGSAGNPEAYRITYSFSDSMSLTVRQQYE